MGLVVAFEFGVVLESDEIGGVVGLSALGLGESSGWVTVGLGEVSGGVVLPGVGWAKSSSAQMLNRSARAAADIIMRLGFMMDYYSGDGCGLGQGV